MAEGTLPSRGKGKAMKLQHSAVEHFGHEVGVVSEDYLSYRVVPDEEAAAVDVDRAYLRNLQNVLDWRADNTPADAEFAKLPDKIRSTLRESMAYTLIKTWVELRCVDTVLGEIGESFNGVDPLRPVLRTKVESARKKLLTVKEHAEFLGMEVVLREPLDDEIQEIREWVASVSTP